jgi:hypothetical protein
VLVQLGEGGTATFNPSAEAPRVQAGRPTVERHMIAELLWQFVFSLSALVACSFLEDADDLRTSLREAPEHVSKEFATKVMREVVEDDDPRLLMLCRCLYPVHVSAMLMLA